MLIVNSRVTSPTPDTELAYLPRGLRALDQVAERHRADLGWLCSSSGPRTSATSWSHASHCGRTSASFLENWAIESWLFAASSAYTLIDRPSG